MRHYTVTQLMLSLTTQHGMYEARTCLLLAAGALGPNFTRKESSSAKMSIPFNRQLSVLQLCCWEFLNNERFSRLLMVSGLNFCEKNDKFRYLNPILWKLGMTHDLGWWLDGKPMFGFLFALIELFCHLLWFWSSEVKCVQLGCFHKSRPLCTQILPVQCCACQSFLASEN